MKATYEDLKKWISEWEGPALEFKTNVHKNIGETVSAFANTYGGLIVFGVAPNKGLKGISDPDAESRILRQVLDNCKPNPKPDQEFLRHEGKTFIILKLEPFPYSQNPCFYGDLCYIRQGTTNLKLTGDDLIEFLKKRSLLNFEELKNRATLKDLNFDKITELLKRRGTNTGELKQEDYKRILTGLNVANYESEFFLKNVALFFFAKEPQSFFNNLEVRIVKYAGLEPEIGQIKFDKRIYGTVPDLVNKTFDSIVENTEHSYSIVGTQRKEAPQYPPEALRELITNAIGHRDYFTSKEVLVEIFSDRLQITNPGGLLTGQNITNFDKTPQHRNPITYRLLRDFGLGEGLGLGIRLIRKQCREARLPDPEFYELGNVFQVVLYNKNSTKKRYSIDFENPRQRQLMAYLEKNKSIKTEQYSKLVGVSQPTAVNDLNELVKQGKVRKIGKFRGAYYELENFK